MEGPYSIKEATTTKEFEKARELFIEYIDHLRIDHQFTEVETGLETIEKEYSKPFGILLLMYHQNTVVGCGGLRKFNAEAVELKRMYVKFEYQGLGLGKILLENLIKRAKEMGYKTVLLDTLPAMASAIHLYEDFGFKETERFNDNPSPEARFFKLDLE
jgi:GNAT superfamily N-acetyltransferase